MNFKLKPEFVVDYLKSAIAAQIELMGMLNRVNRLIGVVTVLLLIFIAFYGCGETAAIDANQSPSPFKKYAFYALVFVDIAFLVFVLLTRYLTRNQDHHENEDSSPLKSERKKDNNVEN